MVPDGYYFALTRCIDLPQKLDNLKDDVNGGKL